jgi:copper(I)-binding protein
MQRRLFLFFLVMGAVYTQAQEIVVSDAYFREPVPGQTRSAGYMTLANQSACPCSLMATSSPDVERVEIHEHRHDNGIMKMRQVDTVKVAAGKQEVFSPGGYHLMLFGVKQTVSDKNAITIVLDFGDCGVVEAPFTRRSLKAP